MTAAALKTADQPAAAPRGAPVIDPAAAILDGAGHAYRSWFVRLPQGAIADDLKEPGLFRKLQQGGKALKKHDRLYLVDFDERWSADALVGEANAEGVTLCGTRIFQFPARTRPLFSDANFRIEWDGAGYAVIRRRDGASVGTTQGSEELAIRELQNQYGRKV